MHLQKPCEQPTLGLTFTAIYFNNNNKSKSGRQLMAMTSLRIYKLITETYDA